MSLSLEQAGVLLAQWAIWSASGLRLGYSSAKWQDDYRPPYDPEIVPEGRELEPGDDVTMLRVDEALSALARSDAHLVHVLRARFVLSQYPNRFVLDRAKRAFIVAYEDLARALAIGYQRN